VEGSLLTCAKAAIAEHEQMGYLITATEKISCLISRGAIHERLYQPGAISADVLARFDQALVALYMVMLRMIALCHRLLAKNTAKRVVHAIFNPGDICELLDQCEKLEVQLEFEVQNCERARSKEIDEESKRLLEILREPILRTDQNVMRFLEKVDVQERLRVLDWISNVLYGLNHQRVKEERTPKTCDWLLGHSRYKEWQETSASITLWLWGTGELQRPALDRSWLTTMISGNWQDLHHLKSCR
jgi:ankyrin repeat domain-containing protein 50